MIIDRVKWHLLQLCKGWIQMHGLRLLQRFGNMCNSSTSSNCSSSNCNISNSSSNMHNSNSNCNCNNSNCNNSNCNNSNCNNSNCNNSNCNSSNHDHELFLTGLSNNSNCNSSNHDHELFLTGLSNRNNHDLFLTGLSNCNNSNNRNNRNIKRTTPMTLTLYYTEWVRMAIGSDGMVVHGKTLIDDLVAVVTKVIKNPCANVVVVSQCIVAKNPYTRNASEAMSKKLKAFTMVNDNDMNHQTNTRQTMPALIGEIIVMAGSFTVIFAILICCINNSPRSPRVRRVRAHNKRR